MADILRFAMAFVIVLLSFLASYIVTFILDKLSHLTSKTKTNVDDEIINSLKRPARIFLPQK